MTRNEKVLMAVLFSLLVCWGSTIVILTKRLHKAETCNKAFVLWFHHNLGININLDKLYEDAVKWVNDPQYQ